MELHYGEKTVYLNELEFLIREVRYMDIKKLIAIERQVYQGEVPWGRSAFLEELNGPNPILYILAIHETEIVGFMGIRFENGDGHITNVAVLEKYQNNGLGRFFLKEGERVARENNYRSLSLEVRVSNLDAQRLYRRLGFVAQRIKPNYYRNNKEDAVDMLYLFEEQADVEK